MLDNIKSSKLSQKNKNLDSNGYSVVELITVIGLMAVLAASFLAVFTSFLVTITRTSYSTQMTTDSQTLLRTMVEELRYGAGVRQSNTITDPSEPSGWNTSDTNFVIITAIPAENSSKEFIIDPVSGDPYLNEYVYYKSGSNLLRRVLANTSAASNSAVTSCPASTAGTPACPGPADRKMSENIDTMTFFLYDQNNNSTPTAADARSILINLRLSRVTFGTPVIYDNSIRITLRNQF